LCLQYSQQVLMMIARAATRLDPNGVLDTVQRINAGEFGGIFNPADVMAVIEIESSFQPNAQRFEAHLNDASIGLMQTLYSTAVDRGYQGGPAGLFDPETSIRFGMRQLKWSFDFLATRLGREPTQEEWIGSYNAGVGNVLKGNIPSGYVTKWRRARARWAS